MVAVWLVHVGQKLLLWGALSAVSLACATLILSFLQMMASYAYNWLQMRPIPTIPGAYPFLGHLLMLERGGKEIHEASWESVTKIQKMFLAEEIPVNF
ncbi:PREDICTED: cytochrome P450 4V2 isoform X2 [Myotis brandtii]|uniref:cytochrome P450 4V2 isoform X2 n=1 Tax=Myotis brandtii TaxID=109478 RepID=UPI000704131D|nr:PREDICTED: cytochrome P450 4V2 isoform X2 [Myotis brandtii]